MGTSYSVIVTCYVTLLIDVHVNLQPQLPSCLGLAMPTTTATAAVVAVVVQVWVLLLQVATTTTQQVIWWCLGQQRQVW